MGCGRDQARRAGADALNRIQRTPEARRDLDGIWDYIARDNVQAADAFVDRIERKLAALAVHPHLGSDRSAVAANLRSVALGNYLIFYQPLASAILVVRVIHAARDISKTFRSR